MDIFKISMKVFEFIIASIIITLCVCSPFIIVGVPLFFTACNFNVTNFCPRYTSFNGIIKSTECSGYHCEKYYETLQYLRGNFHRILQPPPVRHENNKETTKKYYAYNEIDDKWCSITCSKNTFNYECANLNVGDNVVWYKFKNRAEKCERSVVVEERWMAGLVLLLVWPFMVIVAIVVVLPIEFCCKPVRPEHSVVIVY